MDLIAALMPPDMTTGVAAALLVTSVAASFITIAFGIGGGVLLLAVMASLVPPVALIPVHG
ncbi:MAG: sulfite exporter TauE/SafE family protein, partial [Rhodobacterales bacterium]|nr:sulfite exporter TauE/SafE family protein [Rhodobacterales bacterium]